MSMHTNGASHWPEDVPPPAYETEDADAELAALDALYREQRRVRGIEAAPQPAEWTPTSPLAVALWSALPASGQGVDYDRLVSRTADRLEMDHVHVRIGLLALVLTSRIYVMPQPSISGIGYVAGVSLVGRGDDPRLGTAAYRAGTLEGLVR